MPKRLDKKRLEDDIRDGIESSDKSVAQKSVRGSVHGVLRYEPEAPLVSDDTEDTEDGADDPSCWEEEAQMEFFEEDNGLTPLMMAVSRGDAKTVRSLAKDGADVNAEGIDGETALFIAIINGDKELVIELISLGADVNQAKGADVTPLMEALYSECSEDSPNIVFHIVDILLKCGADPDYKNGESDETPRQYALRSKKPEIIWLFERRAGGKLASKKPHGVKIMRDRMRGSLKQFKN